MSKWIKVDPATLKVGDEVRMVDAFSMFQISGKTSPSKIGICVGGIDFTEAPECRTWFVRKPKKAKPEPADCDGRKCMSCVLRQWHDDCQMDCPDCCADTTPEPEPLTRPDEPSPPTRPDEPPVGSFFRVDRTGELYLRMHEGNGDYGYVSLLGDREGDLCTWTDITDHGDTITRLLLVEATDD